MLGQSFSLPGQAPGAQGTRLCHLLSDEALLRRLSGNTGDDCVSALRALNLPDSFWTDEFKVVPCAKTYSHKWTLCPCAHIGETARRRCPRTVNYKAVLCPLVKAKKTCPLGDSCSYAHNVFEHWLHPSRYKTRLCSFGRNCNRSICFFAHSAEELRCVPCTDDKDGDEREYLMQLIVAQESGLLPASMPNSVEPVQPAPIPPLMPNLMPDLSSAFQQALQAPLPASNRPSMSGIPDTSTFMSSRPSMTGIPDLMTSGRPSLSGLPDGAGAAALRASMSGISDGAAAAGMMLHGRPSLNGLPERPTYLQPRTSFSGLPEGLMLNRASSARPSLSGIPPDPTASMLLSFGMQQRAMPNDLNAAATMQRAMSSELGGGAAPFHAAAAAAAAASAVQHAVLQSNDLASMARAYSRDLMGAGSGGSGSPSPLQTGAVSLDQRLSSGTLNNMMHGNHSSFFTTSSRSLGSGFRRDPNLAHAPSINSVESDSVVQLRSGGMTGPAGGVGSTVFAAAACNGGMGAGPGAMMGFDALMNPQAPSRLSDPGANLQLPLPHCLSGHLAAAGHTGMTRGSDSGGGLMGASAADFSGLHSLLPLMNNALAAGALTLPGEQGAMKARGVNSSPNPGLPVVISAEAIRRSNSGMSGSTSARVQSPQLVETTASSPLHSGSLTPLSVNSASEPAAPEVGLLMHQSLQQHHQQGMFVHVGGSPPDGTGYEGVTKAGPGGAAAAPGFGLGAVGMMGAGSGVGAATASGVDQAYLNDLMARLQDQGVNKEQLVSSLSQLLAQLLSVGN